MKSIGVIPARLGSTRLKDKVLLPIAGKPMIEHVWRRARKAAQLDDLIVACDDVLIADCVKTFGGKSVMTRKDHPNGTSRIAEAVAAMDAEVVINIQGDEPMIDPHAIDQLVEALRSDSSLPVATLAVRGHDLTEFSDPNVVKVVCDNQGNALYFSRAPLPFHRRSAAAPAYLKHIGIYGYRKSFLRQFISWPEGKLEGIEGLEQLRVLEHGYVIRVVETGYDSHSVDTAEDLARMEARMRSQGSFSNA